MAQIEFYKKNDSDKVWWVDDTESVGLHLFSFDRQKVYNLYADYPHKLTQEERRIFDAENPYWVDYFKDRRKCPGIRS